MANAVTWKNMGTVSGAGALTTAAKSGQNIGAGIASIGDAFREYGDKKKEQETDLAIGALRAALPEERHDLMKGFVDSGITMDNERIGKTLTELDKAEIAEEALAYSRGRDVITDARADRKFSESQKRNKLLNAGTVLSNQQKQSDINLDTEKRAWFAGGQLKNATNNGDVFGELNRFDSAPISVRSSDEYGIRKNQLIQSAGNQILESLGGPGPGANNKTKYMDKAISLAKESGLGGDSINGIKDYLTEQIGLKVNADEAPDRAVLQANNAVRGILAPMVNSGQNFGSDDFMNIVTGEARKFGVDRGKIVNENLDTVQGIVSREYNGSMDQLQQESIALTDLINSPDADYTMKGKGLAALRSGYTAMLDKLNGIQGDFGVNQKQFVYITEGLQTSEGIGLMAKRIVEAEDMINKQRVDDADTLDRKIEAEGKVREGFKDKHTANTLREKLKGKSDAWGSGQDEVIAGLVDRMRKAGMNDDELIFKAIGDVAHFEDRIIDRLVSIGGRKDDAMFTEVAERYGDIRATYPLAYPEKKKAAGPPPTAKVDTVKELSSVDKIKASAKAAGNPVTDAEAELLVRRDNSDIKKLFVGNDKTKSDNKKAWNIILGVIRGAGSKIGEIPGDIKQSAGDIMFQATASREEDLALMRLRERQRREKRKKITEAGK